MNYCGLFTSSLMYGAEIKQLSLGMIVMKAEDITKSNPVEKYMGILFIHLIHVCCVRAIL